MPPRVPARKPSPRSPAARHLPRKFLVIVDGSAEEKHALRYAARRMAQLGGTIALLAVLEPEGIAHWLGVTGLMRADARKAARRVLNARAKTVQTICARTPETLIREGEKVESILALLDEDKSISTLILAASDESNSPGPLIEALARGTTRFPIPVTIVPAGMSEDALDALT